MSDILLLAHELLCAMLIYSVFCRAVRMDSKVRIDVRISFWCLGMVGCMGMPAPLVWAFEPSAFTLLLVGVVVVVQLVTARYWAQGVPYSFYKPECAPKRRASDHVKGGISC